MHNRLGCSELTILGMPMTNVETGAAFKLFCEKFTPLESPEHLPQLIDKCTGASYCECHIKAEKLVALATLDAPLDLDEPEYRANREMVLNAGAFSAMKSDALQGRSFSNIVAEFTANETEKPLSIIGGQHRMKAIDEALKNGMDEFHGIKVYFDLTTDQRLDVQLISNTNIAISADLIDRMQETAKGPELRQWCQDVGLLEADIDFADKHVRGGPIPVGLARSFILNYLAGKKIDAANFDKTETTPKLNERGDEWDKIRETGGIWKDEGLRDAAKNFSELVKAQRKWFEENMQKKGKPKPDYPEKALNAAVLSGWSYVAGMLQANKVRLKRHFDLAAIASNDPLNASALADGNHKTDAENYRGLGYRTDAKERGRFVELFYMQAESGKGITPNLVDAAIKQYHAKHAALDAAKAKEKAGHG